MSNTHRRVVAIVNPATGRSSLGPIPDEFRRLALRHNIELEVAFTAHAGHAIELARAAANRAETIVAVGGDGTVSDVVTGVLGTEVSVGIVPAGSTNMIAKELGIPRSIPDAIALAMTSSATTRIDVAQVGETTFLHMAGAGFDAAIMRDANKSIKRRWGWLAYLPAALRNLSYPAFKAELTIDGVCEVVEARTILLAIGSSIIQPRFSVGEGICRTDGFVDVCIYNPPNILATMSCAWWISRGTPGRSRWLRQQRGKSIRLSSTNEVPFEIDGDVFGTLPKEIKMLEDGVSVIVPMNKPASTA